MTYINVKFIKFQLIRNERNLMLRFSSRIFINKILNIIELNFTKF